jgi:hypothetical protein
MMMHGLANVKFTTPVFLDFGLAMTCLSLVFKVTSVAVSLQKDQGATVLFPIIVS